MNFNFLPQFGQLCLYLPAFYTSQLLRLHWLRPFSCPGRGILQQWRERMTIATPEEGMVEKSRCNNHVSLPKFVNQSDEV